MIENENDEELDYGYELEDDEGQPLQVDDDADVVIVPDSFSDGGDNVGEEGDGEDDKTPSAAKP
jgi:hypothetical protein